MTNENYVNGNYKFEYYSTSKKEYIDFDDMDGEYMKNVVRKVIREDTRLPVRVTEFDTNEIPVWGQVTCLTIASELTYGKVSIEQPIKNMRGFLEGIDTNIEREDNRL